MLWAKLSKEKKRLTNTVGLHFGKITLGHWVSVWDLSTLHTGGSIRAANLIIDLIVGALFVLGWSK